MFFQTTTLAGSEFLLCVGPHVTQKHSISLSMFLNVRVPPSIHLPHFEPTQIIGCASESKLVPGTWDE